MPDESRPTRQPLRWLKIAAAAVLFCLTASAVFVTFRWPYTEQRIIEGLSRATASTVRAGLFRTRVFPIPGATLEKLTVSRVDGRPIAVAERLVIRSSWWTVLTLQRRAGQMKIEGLQVHIPASLPPPVQRQEKKGGDTTIGEFIADGATVSLSSGRFAFHRLRLHELGKKSRIRFDTQFANPHPPGELTATGTLGPFPEGETGLAPVSGSYELKNGRLDQYGQTSGLVYSKGRFRGKLERITAEAGFEFTDFRTDPDHRSVDMKVGFAGLVNALTGDVQVQSLGIDLLRTHLDAAGAVRDKTIDLEFRGDRARIQDLIRVFSKANPPPMSGPLRFRARVRVPPGDAPFLQRVRLDGVFAIDEARWNKPRTQAKINDLSARARGEKEDVVMVASDLKGEASLRGGVATLSDVSFRIPGAVASGGGTYNVLNKRVNLQGTVSMAADVSEAASGIKSVLLKPFDALFRRKKKKGAVLPVSITGVLPHPKYSIRLRR